MLIKLYSFDSVNFVNSELVRHSFRKIKSLTTFSSFEPIRMGEVKCLELVKENATHCLTSL